MGKVPELRQLLRSLCIQARWKYAVFWKFRGRSQTLLAWEDGYCVPSEPRSSTREESWNGYFNGERGFISFSSGMNALDGCITACPIELAVASMSCHLYSLGEGIVGKVASAGKHRWVIPKAYNSKIPAELQPQFAAGIKAVLFVPVIPFGVVQLGSLEMIAEDSKLVDLVKDLFSPLAAGCGFFDSFPHCPSLLSFSERSFSRPGHTSAALIAHDDGLFEAGGDLSLDGNTWRSIYGAIAGDGVDGPDLSSVIEESFPVFSPDLVAEMDWTLGKELCLDVPVGAELDQLLVPGGAAWFSGEDLLNSSSPSEDMAESGAPRSVPPELTEFLDLERLLDSLIVEFLDPEAGSSSSGGASPSSSDDQLAGSCLTHIKSEIDPPAAPLTPHLEPSSMSPTESQSRSGGSAVLDEEHSKRAEKKTGSPSTERGKTRGADSHRPRPRDRQLIQDRIKELRELVPNASKCSIDALLDRTIKLMHFLQSISSQGEKLRQYSQLKGKGKKRKRAEADVSAGEASWGCDVMSQAEACPIVVENLDSPGHMLVEVLCADYGLFLEIAQVIKRLDLTILRGVLETRSHELWAHFIVEGSRGFHRMDILWPLMQLLQRHSGPFGCSFRASTGTNCVTV